MLIEQAIFASGHSERGDGYHLVARSGKLAERDADELTNWAPSHDSLCAAGAAGASHNFVHLASGNFCVSKTMAAGAEYSGRGGVQAYTQCLIVPPEGLERFANNPFSILRAVSATGELAPQERPRAKLEPIRLLGRAPAVDLMLLAQVALHPGARAMAVLVQHALQAERLVIVGPDAEQLLAGFITCLPVAKRPQFSFSTGLRLSVRRPLRLAVVPEATSEVARFARQCGAELLRLDQLAAQSIELDEWAALVETSLRQSKFNALATEVARGAKASAASASRASSTLRARTPAAIDFAEDDFPDGAFPDDDGPNTASTYDSAAPVSPVAAPLGPRGIWSGEAPAGRAERQASSGRQGVATLPLAAEHSAARLSAAEVVARPNHDPWRHDPDTLEMLERLDDLVYETIGGRSGAFEELVEYWPQVISQLDQAAVDESREQYLRYALAVWNANGSDDRPAPERAMAAIDVLCLLFPEGEF